MRLVDLCVVGPLLPALPLPPRTASPPLMAGPRAPGPSAPPAAVPAPGADGRYPLGLLMVRDAPRCASLLAALEAVPAPPAARGGPAVVDLATFKRQFDAATMGALKYVDWSNLIAAGGLVEACLRPAPAGADTE
jgi:hypothetical protein